MTPILHEDYAGAPIVLPGDPSQVLDPADEPALAARIGHDIVTSDGTTLLGADDKAGVAEIMTAVAYLHGTDEPRATLRVGFTVDEEVGRGPDHFDIEAFGAEAAYTLDGSGIGELEIETFSARQLKVIIEGRSEHPGTAKGKLVNAVKLAADFVAAFPRDELSPETTEGREGFIHPSQIAATNEHAVVTLIIRDHDDELLEQHTALVHRLAAEIEEREPRASVSIETWDQYRNMRTAIEQHPQIVTNAEEAIRRSGVEPVRTIIRGGTDGARLTAMGLPTPNLFTGGQKYHSRREWASVQDMATAAAMAVELVRVWGERCLTGRARRRVVALDAGEARRQSQRLRRTVLSGRARRSRASHGRSGASPGSGGGALRPSRSARTRRGAATRRSCGGRRSPRPRASAAARRGCAG